MWYVFIAVVDDGRERIIVAEEIDEGNGVFVDHAWNRDTVASLVNVRSVNSPLFAVTTSVLDSSSRIVVRESY